MSWLEHFDAARASLARSDLQGAERELRSALTVAERDEDGGHARPGLQLELARLLIFQEHWHEARPLLDAALAAALDDPGLLGVAIDAGILRAGDYAAHGEHKPAEEAFRRVLQSLEAVVPPDDPRLAYALINLATLLLEQPERGADVGQLLHQALGMLSQGEGDHRLDEALVVKLLGELALQQGDYPKAMDLLEDALEVREELLGPKHHVVAATLLPLAAVYFELGKLAASRDCLARWVGLYAQFPGHSAERLAEGRNRLEHLETLTRTEA